MKNHRSRIQFKEVAKRRSVHGLNHIYFVYYLSTIFVIYLTLFFISHNVFLVFPVCKHPPEVAYHKVSSILDHHQSRRCSGQHLQLLRLGPPKQVG